MNKKLSYISTWCVFLLYSVLDFDWILNKNFISILTKFSDFFKFPKKKAFIYYKILST